MHADYVPRVAFQFNTQAWIPDMQRSRADDVPGTDAGTDALSPAMLHGIADSIRALMHGVHDHDQLAYFLRVLQNVLDGMLRSQLLASERVYKLDCIVQCMLMAGLLASGSQLKDAVIRGLLIASPDAAAHQHYLTILQQPHSLPSRDTLYRHRLTMHMAYCKVHAERLSKMLNDGGVVRFGTMDSSPQGGHDWCMVGFSTVSVNDLVTSVALSSRLIELGRADEAIGEEGDADANADEEALIIATLRDRLQILPGVPTVLGSGRCGIEHKLHCLVHCCRLTASSWREAAALITSTCTWTGDLGTESALTQCKA